MAARGDVSGARSHFGLIIKGAPARQHTFIYNTVLKAYAWAGDLEGATAWFRRMVTDSIRMNSKTFGKVIKAAANTGSSDQAKRWLGRCEQEFGRNYVALNTVIDACCRAGQVDEAVDLVRQMASHDIQPNLITVSSLIAGFARGGRAEEAAQWLHHADSVSLVPDINCHNSVLHALGKSGQPASAVDWLHRMYRLGPEPNSVTYNTLVNGFAELGDLDPMVTLRRQKGG